MANRTAAACRVLVSFTLATSALAGHAKAQELCKNSIWIILAHSTDPRVPEAPMEIFLNGEGRGTAQRVVLQHKVAGAGSWPEVAVIYSCHDVNAVRVATGRTDIMSLDIGGLRPSNLLFAKPVRPDGRWLELLHTDDSGWQGGTPSLRVEIPSTEKAQTATVQGYLGDGTNPNLENVDLWWHDDRPAAARWTPRQSGCTAYVAISSADPLPPQPTRAPRLSLRCPVRRTCGSGCIRAPGG